MRWTQSLIVTQKEDPQDAEIVSHKLMLRAGLLRKVMSGTYDYLPLGWRAMLKAMQIVREEMGAAGALEVSMPYAQPFELWQESGRAGAIGPEMATFTDRKGAKVCLGPTAEEIVTDIVRGTVRSYKQLPVNLYQIGPKFRDEIRPRYGVMRSREFIMKDAYSFDIDLAGLDESYRKMVIAYCRIFSRCGLNYTLVEADSGAMGGSASCEFMVPCEVGENILAVCDELNYAANIEKAPAAKPERPNTAQLPREEVATPGKKTVEEVSGFLRCKPSDLMKTLLYTVGNRTVAVLVAGHFEINEVKLNNLFAGEPVAMADDETVRRVTGAPVGFAGPVGLKNVEIIADGSVNGMANFVCGANKADTHYKNVNLDRDFQITRWADLRNVVEGDFCKTDKGSGKYRLMRGIEVGHVFKLGTKYSVSMKAMFLDKDGKEKPCIMGCYGIGPARIVASAVELHCDDKGICWPMSIAPYEVLITATNMKSAEVAQAAEKLYGELTKAGVDVLYDDRDERAGVKFNDADLIGIPLRVTIGDRGIKNGIVEIKPRKAASAEEVKVEASVARILELKREMTPQPTVKY